MTFDLLADLRTMLVEILRDGPLPLSEVHARFDRRLEAQRMALSQWNGRQKSLCGQLLNELAATGRAESARIANEGVRWGLVNG